VLVSPLVGGAAVVAIRLAAAARERGIRCIAWVPGPGPASEALSTAEVPWRTYGLTAMQSGTGPHLIACARMIPGLLGTSRPVVHVHNPVVYRFLRPALAAARARVVVHFHIEPGPEEIARVLEYPPDHVVACARYIAATINHAQGPASAVPVSGVPNAVDLRRFQPGDRGDARRAVGLETASPVLIMLANLAPHKGQTTAVRALQLLRTRGIHAECWLAGEDRTPSRAFESELRTLTETLGVSASVRFLGFRADGPDLLRAADVFLLPSGHEGLPLSIIEAQSAGIPVVGSTIPGVRELVEDNVTGFVVDPEDVDGYADRIARLITDADLRARITSAARQKAIAESDWSMFEAKMFGIYEALGPGLAGAPDA